jgi:hypothetical protein
VCQWPGCESHFNDLVSQWFCFNCQRGVFKGAMCEFVPMWRVVVY